MSSGQPASSQGEAALSVASERSRLRTLATRIAVDGGVVVFLLLLIVAFSVSLPITFPTTANLQLVLGSQAVPMSVVFHPAQVQRPVASGRGQTMPLRQAAKRCSVLPSSPYFLSSFAKSVQSPVTGYQARSKCRIP